MILALLLLLSTFTKASCLKETTDQEYVKLGLEEVRQILGLDMTAFGGSQGGDPMAQRFANAVANFRASKRGEDCDISEWTHESITVVPWQPHGKKSVEVFRKFLASYRDIILDKKPEGMLMGIGIGYIEEDLKNRSLRNLFSPEKVNAHLVIVFTSVLPMDTAALEKFIGSGKVHMNLDAINTSDPKLQEVVAKWATRCANALDPENEHEEFGFLVQSWAFYGIGDEGLINHLENNTEDEVKNSMSIGWIQQRKLQYERNAAPKVVRTELWYLILAKRNQKFGNGS